MIIASFNVYGSDLPGNFINEKSIEVDSERIGGEKSATILPNIEKYISVGTGTMRTSKWPKPFHPIEELVVKNIGASSLGFIYQGLHNFLSTP